MKLQATITLSEGVEHLQHLLGTEQAFASERASYTLERHGKQLQVHVTASDAIALRATVTSITRVLALYEKAKHGTDA